MAEWSIIMNMSLLFIVPLVIVILLAMPFIPIYRGIVTGKKAKNTLIFNLCAFFGVAAVMMVLPMGNVIAFAETEVVVAELISTGAGMGYIAAAISTGLACLGAGIAVAGAAPAAIGAFSEDAANFGKGLIFVVLGEGVAIYGMLISILIINAL